MVFLMPRQAVRDGWPAFFVFLAEDVQEMRGAGFRRDGTASHTESGKSGS